MGARRRRGDTISKDVPITAPFFINGPVMSRAPVSQRYRKLALQRAYICQEKLDEGGIYSTGRKCTVGGRASYLCNHRLSFLKSTF